MEKRYNMSKLDRHSGNIIMCVTEGVVGILLLIDPRAFTGGIIILFGVLLVLNGVRGGASIIGGPIPRRQPGKTPLPWALPLCWQDYSVSFNANGFWTCSQISLFFTVL